MERRITYFTEKLIVLNSLVDNFNTFKYNILTTGVKCSENKGLNRTRRRCRFWDESLE